MSGGIAQLVAIGAQDAHIVGRPEVSFFRSTYKRHTNFAQTVEKQVIQGNPVANGMSTVRFERKGDLLGYVYITNRNTPANRNLAGWEAEISKVELLLGGQVIDTHDAVFSQRLAPLLLGQTYSKSHKALGNGGNSTKIYPLRFSFCENAQSALPLVALQYHDVEIRITWGATLASDAYEVHAQFIYLDTDERTALASTPQNMLITQTQKAIKSDSAVQELSFNHPIKFLCSYRTSGTDFVGTAEAKTKLQINGTDVGDAKLANPHYTSGSLYYHAPFADFDGAIDTHFLYPFCLDTSKLQPTGELNFSRVDSARLVTDAGTFQSDIYAVGYNILRIEQGMGGLMYSN
tara:strand:- start:44598 stop:45641 length:1044 start_codon:yes stop_codon:yes gene_type:complete